MNHHVLDRNREEEAVAHNNYFIQQTDVVGVRGLSSLQKVTAALRMLVYGMTADVIDDYVRIDRSHLFEDLAEGHGPEVRYTINGHEYNMGYYLADGIYPFWAIFVKTISKPLGNKKKYLATAQESVRKDVERAFEVLQSRFSMVRGPSRYLDVHTMKYIMAACIILHNMIIEDERELHMEEEHFDTDVAIPIITPNRSRASTPREFIQVHKKIRDKQVHFQLQNDLMEHLCQMHGGDMN
ncbi:uncharacterized protein LOC141695338 [Apium graveolens]|uniref:uncharacterized protein LOC141695338 n=1 Tax=Apium graveolens TaxID=4045 RepID=UPI003D7A3042